MNTKKLLLILFLFGLCLPVFGQVKVKGYYKSNGTYVEPHVRSSPNSTKTDNYSYPGNTTPISPPSGNYVPASSTDKWIDGYYRTDGTFVKGHWRSAPNSNETDNFSYPGNVNPYTGKLAPGRQVEVKATKLNIRSGASTDYSIVTTLDYGTQIQIIQNIDNDWTKIQYEYYDIYGTKVMKTGYVSNNHIRPVSETPNTTTIAEITTPMAFYVTASELNVRTGPSTKNTIITTVKNGELVWVIEVVNAEWVKITTSYYDISSGILQKFTGYVSRDYLSSTLK